MRTDFAQCLRSAPFVPILLAATSLLAPSLSAQEAGAAADDLSAGHGETAPPPLLEPVGDEIRLREKHMQMQINCACPRENWSRTLKNCPDGCANPQKSELLAQLKSGWTDAEILDWMVAEYGPKVRSDPGLTGSGIWTRILPFAALLGGAWFAGRVMFRWQKAGEVARAERAERRAQRDEVTPDEIARIERDLDSID